MQARRHLSLGMILGLAIACATPSEGNPSSGGSSSGARSAAARSYGHVDRVGARVRPSRAPVIVSVSGPASVAVGDTFELEIEIDQRTAGVATELSVELPEGVELTDGTLSESLPADVDVIHRRLVIRLLEGAPRTDVSVAVDAVGANYGAHAQAYYRFGRGTSNLPVPPRVGTPMTVHGVSLGGSIPLGHSLEQH